MRNLKGFVEIKFRKLLSNFPQPFATTKQNQERPSQPLIFEYLILQKLFRKPYERRMFLKTVQNVKLHCGKLFPLCQKVLVYFPKRLFTPQKVSKALKLQMRQVILSYR